MKANELKSSDLMVGDWVMHANGTPMQVTKINPSNFRCGSDYWSDNNAFQPIPLTPEILKKNFEELYCENGIYIYSGIDGRVIIQNHYNVKGWDWTLDYDTQTGTASALGRVYYIHELQCYLRGNKIEKEIVV